MKSKKIDWIKVLKKAGIITLEVLIAGLITYLTENKVFMLAVPILEAARNTVKFKYDIKYL